MTATDMLVLFLVLGYAGFCAWIFHNSRGCEKRGRRDTGADEQARVSCPDTKQSATARKAA
jgi:hypothetical protein